MPSRKSTTEKGLGWQHQQQVKALLNSHIDGSPCWWCGEPMFVDPQRNWDGESLAGDHSIARRGGRVASKADRLLHGKCNKKRGVGDHDDRRPVVTGEPVVRAAEDAGLGVRAMPWPI